MKTYKGTVGTLPPDKSISHRAALIASLATGETVIDNYSGGLDNQTTLKALAQLGLSIRREPTKVIIKSNGLFSFKKSDTPIDCENSGSTMRMLSGILAAQPFASVLIGDASLMKRPMKRVKTPLEQMGASILLSESDTPPVRISGNTTLHGRDFVMQTSSAQVKSLIIFAALHASGETTIQEPVQSRNHTEQMLGLTLRDGKIIVTGGQPIAAKSFVVPADPSAAAFLVALGLLAKDSEVVLQQVCLNPTRTFFLDVLRNAGATLNIENEKNISGETVGDIVVVPSRLAPLNLFGTDPAKLIDELPILAVLSALTTDRFVLHNAAELRAKECDRIAALVLNLRALGFAVEEFPDGLEVTGRRVVPHQSVKIQTFHDHRIAMSFFIAGLFQDNGITLDDTDCVAVSFPNFFDIIHRLEKI
jgi:3-phosphoshikimate 1-carboxyvinyltransferase